MPAPTAPTPPSDLAVRTSPLAAWVLVPFLAAGLLSCAWLMVKGPISSLPAKVDSDMLLHGELTHRFAKELAKAPMAIQAANLERGASWLAFGDTGPRVRPGCPGWLFISDELRINRHAQANAQTKAQAVIDLQRQLGEKGIELQVVVVPDKSRIAVAQLCGVYRPAVLNSRIQDWTATLQAAGVSALDLTDTLKPLGPEAYLRTDTHWSEIGSNAGAQALAKRIQQREIKATPEQTFEITQAPLAVRPGDLVRLAGLDWLPPKLQPPGESVAASSAHEAGGATSNTDDLFGDAGLPNVALIGTSFSRNSNFVGFLQKALNAPVGNFSKDGGEFSGAAKAYFDSPAFKQTPPKLLIWEIPERDLQTPYDTISIGR
ncbi:alginate O-acetyltransferase complex protein AlgJ [Pseudomonas sp. NFACC25]|uniref:alginate O-acetyltransferase AlgX-related protein n=1 Tax=Pseudomonas sp. NFACC25 TaxID=1566188 RepID=UPI00087704CC|nr:cell division protein FtsQ [Pseudomonas sp. NFACC25]SCX35095.1 alginate O-acetyltransferase complex protein AlgJ [Pseudomonas sp. NFACC25]